MSKIYPWMPKKHRSSNHPAYLIRRNKQPKPEVEKPLLRFEGYPDWPDMLNTLSKGFVLERKKQ